MDLISQAADLESRAVRPARELGAYEALWCQEGATFKTLAAKFRAQPDSVPSDFVAPAEAERFARTALGTIREAGIRHFGVRVQGAGEYPGRLLDATRGDHYYLADGDRCFCFGEYFADQGWGHSPTNQLIFNYKCKPTEKSGRLFWKEQAIATIASGLKGAIARQEVERHTWVPIPSSKLPDHPEYDDRIVQTLRRAFAGYNADVRELLRQSVSANADHDSNTRMTPESLFELLVINHDAWNRAPPHSIMLFDDVLTTGKHDSSESRHIN